MIDGILFDLDGTLIDTHEANFLAYQSGLKLIGLEIDRKKFESTIGKDSRQFLSEIFPELSEKEINLVRSYKSKNYSQFFSKMVVNDFFVRIIKENRDKTIALVTNGKKINVLEVLQFHGLLELFDHVITGDDVPFGKPSNLIYLHALKVLKLNPDQVIAFEDSLAGRQSAQSAGIACINF